MRRWAMMVLAATLAGGGAAADAASTTQQKIATSCQSCHGLGGDSASPKVPRLNGQMPGYISVRLKAFRDPTKQTPDAIHAMWDTSTHIGDDEIAEIAQYYAAQTPTAAAASSSALAKEGARLFAGGAKGVPACQACHGLHGEGMGMAPRLAGQHAAYLDYQLTAFMVTMREQGTMNHSALDISDDQIKALVAYLGRD